MREIIEREIRIDYRNSLLSKEEYIKEIEYMRESRMRGLSLVDMFWDLGYELESKEVYKVWDEIKNDL